MNLKAVPPCPVCAGTSAKQVQMIELQEQHRAYVPGNREIQEKLNEAAEIESGRYSLYRCGSCELTFCSPFKAPSAEWYGVFYSTRPLYPTYRWEFDFVLGRIGRAQSVGEFGCGNGEFLKKCRQRGVKAIGADFSLDAVDSCLAQGLTAKLIDVATGQGEPLPPQACSHIVAFQVLEHLDNIRALFDLASKWAAVDAKFWVAVPSDRRPSRALEERDRLDEPPHHMTRWSSEALRHVGESGGWLLHALHYEPLSFSGLLWWCTTRAAGYKNASERHLFKLPIMEKLLRTWFTPAGLTRALQFRGRISGQTMLAEYHKR